MALTPWLAAGGQLIASRFEQHDVRSLLPVESEVRSLVYELIANIVRVTDLALSDTLVKVQTLLLVVY